ncbi:hypothetical protein CPC08DRAFT_707655 [Agrocybe pediades]|nr:hypothetical protein CPC08DRAFT_707655 [Agrocybe pediades]
MSSNKLWCVLRTLHRYNSIRWTLSGILLMSALYTYSLNQLSDDHPKPIAKVEHYTRVKRLQAAQHARIEREEQQKRLYESQPFRFLDLPPEIGIMILSHCAAWPATYQSLVCVSEHVQQLTFHACLPRMPIRLISTEQIHSFDGLLRARPNSDVAQLIRHMWMTPLKREAIPTAISIVKRCKNLLSLASNFHIIQESILLRGNRPTHLYCKDLTLLSLRSEAWTTLLNTANGSAFFRQLTHLRLIGDRVPQDFHLPNLTHFSYGNDTLECSTSTGLAMLDNKPSYPKLQTVIVTRPRASAGGLRISRASAKSRVFIFELPPRRTELEMWCDNASRRDMWELCA